ncbi:hypothetical protein Aduo_005584 [Ancylostoma duodenale]
MFYAYPSERPIAELNYVIHLRRSKGGLHFTSDRTVDVLEACVINRNYCLFLENNQEHHIMLPNIIVMHDYEVEVRAWKHGKSFYQEYGAELTQSAS